MPFKSAAQRKFLHMREPKVAKKFEEHGPKGSEPKRKSRVGKGFQGGNVADSPSFGDAVQRRLARGGQQMPSGRTVPSSRVQSTLSPTDKVRKADPLQATVNRKLRRRYGQSK